MRTVSCLWIVAILFMAQGASAEVLPVSADLGVIESPELNPEAAGIKECGVAAKVKQKLTFQDVKTSGNNLVFTDKTPKLFWFAQFGISGSLKNNLLPAYRIQWFSPDGQIFHEEKFKASFWNETFIKKSIDLKTPVQSPCLGRWRVRVWKKDVLIDDRFFEIVKSGDSGD